MKIKIQQRLFLALLAASGLAVVSLFFILQWSLGRGFLKYVNTLEQERLEQLAQGLEQMYRKDGGWDVLRQDGRGRLRLMLRALPEEVPEPEPALLPDDHGDRDDQLRRPQPPPPRPRDRAFISRLLLLDENHQPIFSPPGALLSTAELRRLNLRGQTIGYLGLLPRRELSESHHLHFVQQQKTAMALVAGLVLLISALISLPLARRLVQPLKTLAAAARRLAGGDYAARVVVGSADELGQLASDFNALALTLEKNEQARRRWVADISHELRTPLAVLRGEIEALQDGVRPVSVEAISSLHAEVLQLGRLVDDLYQLALSDIGGLDYRKETVELADLLTGSLEPFRPEFAARRIELAVLPPGKAEMIVFADPKRLQQLFANLLDNSLKYTETGGRLEVSMERGQGRVLIHLQDSGPGVPESELGRLFDRLYRVEGSRSRASGGAGLGLSICKNIVEAHEGTITALPSPLGGLKITVTLPTAGTAEERP